MTTREEIKRMRSDLPKKYLADHAAAPSGAAFADEMYAQGMIAAFDAVLAALSPLGEPTEGLELVRTSLERIRDFPYVGVQASYAIVSIAREGLAALRASVAGWQDISTAPKADDFLVRHRGRIRQVSLYDPPAKDIVPLNTVIDSERGRMWVATHWMPLPAMVAEQGTKP